MPSIVMLILQLVGPLIADWLKKWLEKKLKTAEAAVLKGNPGFAAGDAGQMSEAVLRAALAATPIRQRLRRNFLRNLIAEVPKAAAAGAKKLPKAAAEELSSNASSVPAEE